ncbi:helix-hairpin-helix domain-containing protein [Aeromicrobium chenweiae]|uniref:DNA-binding protein n=1 Tax=Aeromicrobium chenweiae TaxID=2079793 RepID=A0A2S0WKJ4_9ACTN|nr:helix-hairpin-helix domain-containing protein [Aeromicrobium chenweiae]AWB91760.1 DNA-binding protein [Aeromicrobium chenweiae]TGN32602.1 ComEA family DNA-binding protein [Aeromicrobium chenweiae]
MKPTHREEPDETRAEIARRRLAQLAASFDAELPPAEDEPVRVRPRVEVPHVRALAAVAVAASVLLVWWLLSGRPESSGPVAPLAFASSPSTGAPSGPGPTAAADARTSAPPGQAAQVVVDVAGKVRRPGIVTVPRGSRVYQAIEAAGGVKGQVDTTSLNLARELTDGEQILVGLDPVDVGGAPAPAAAAPGTGASAPSVAKINLNTATAEQLDTLPGVGPVTAQAILGWREDNGRFSSVDDLLDVKGIGEATLAELRDLVVV